MSPYTMPSAVSGEKPGIAAMVQRFSWTAVSCVVRPPALKMD
jgi:hypothetical protein